MEIDKKCSDRDRQIARNAGTFFFLKYWYVWFSEIGGDLGEPDCKAGGEESLPKKKPRGPTFGVNNHFVGGGRNMAESECLKCNACPKSGLDRRVVEVEESIDGG